MLADINIKYDYLLIIRKFASFILDFFKEDGAFDVSEIVKLWVAEGFVKPSRSKSVEEVGEEYLRDIIASCYCV